MAEYLTGFRMGRNSTNRIRNQGNFDTVLCLKTHQNATTVAHFRATFTTCIAVGKNAPTAMARP